MTKFQPLYLSSTYVSSNALYLSAISSSPYIYFVASQYIVASSSQKHVSQLKLTRDALASHNHKKDKLDESEMPPVSFETNGIFLSWTSHLQFALFDLSLSSR